MEEELEMPSTNLSKLFNETKNQNDKENSSNKNFNNNLLMKYKN